MNATISNGGKARRIFDGFARCGVGRNTEARTWQMEFCAGDVWPVREAGEDGWPQNGPKTLTTDAH